jgi:hypothetical protein
MTSRSRQIWKDIYEKHGWTWPTEPTPHRVVVVHPVYRYMPDELDALYEREERAGVAAPLRGRAAIVAYEEGVRSEDF